MLPSVQQFSLNSQENNETYHEISPRFQQREYNATYRPKNELESSFQLSAVNYDNQLSFPNIAQQISQNVTRNTEILEHFTLNGVQEQQEVNTQAADLPPVQQIQALNQQNLEYQTLISQYKLALGKMTAEIKRLKQAQQDAAGASYAAPRAQDAVPVDELAADESAGKAQRAQDAQVLQLSQLSQDDGQEAHEQAGYQPVQQPNGWGEQRAEQQASQTAEQQPNRQAEQPREQQPDLQRQDAGDATDKARPQADQPAPQGPSEPDAAPQQRSPGTAEERDDARGQAGALQAELSRAREENRALTARLEQLQEQNNTLLSQSATSQSGFKDEEYINQLNNQLEQTCQQSNQTIARLKQKIAELERNKLDRQFAGFWETGLQYNDVALQNALKAVLRHYQVYQYYNNELGKSAQYFKDAAEFLYCKLCKFQELVIQERREMRDAFQRLKCDERTKGEIKSILMKY